MCGCPPLAGECGGPPFVFAPAPARWQSPKGAAVAPGCASERASVRAWCEPRQAGANRAERCADENRTPSGRYESWAFCCGRRGGGVCHEHAVMKATPFTLWAGSRFLPFYCRKKKNVVTHQAVLRLHNGRPTLYYFQGAAFKRSPKWVYTCKCALF